MESPEQTPLTEFVELRYGYLKVKNLKEKLNNNNSDKVPNDELKKVDS